MTDCVPVIIISHAIIPLQWHISLASDTYARLILFTGQVVKAWDISVMTMQKGEVCSLLCSPDYTYGGPGNPPKVPPNSSLLFEVSMQMDALTSLQQYLKHRVSAANNDYFAINLPLFRKCPK